MPILYCNKTMTWLNSSFTNNDSSSGDGGGVRGESASSGRQQGKSSGGGGWMVVVNTGLTTWKTKCLIRIMVLYLGSFVLAVYLLDSHLQEVVQDMIYIRTHPSFTVPSIGDGKGTTTTSDYPDMKRRGKDRDLGTKNKIVSAVLKGGAQPVFGTYARFDRNTTEGVYALPTSLFGADCDNSHNKSMHYNVTTTDSRTGSSTIRGIALVLHACTHNALKFFSPESPDCRLCIGLSEEMLIVRILLSRQYAVLALTSHDTQHGCWSGSPREIRHVQNALHEFQQMIIRKLQQDIKKNRNTNCNYDKHDVLNITTAAIRNHVIAIGASSGGHFAASLLTHQIATTGALSMVSSLGDPLIRRLWDLDKNITDTQHKTDVTKLYLAPMPRDQATTKQTKRDYIRVMERLPGSAATHTAIAKRTGNKLNQDKNRSRIQVRYDDTTCIPIPVTPTYLYERVPNLSFQSATEIVQELVKAKHLVSSSASDNNPSIGAAVGSNKNGIVVPNDGSGNTGGASYMLVKDPTRSDWRDVLQQTCGGKVTDTNNNSGSSIQSMDVGPLGGGCLENQILTPGKSPLAKSLHRAWAYHEYCSEAVIRFLKWMDDTKT